MRLSYSSINTYETCPAKYRFEYEERLPTVLGPALSFGESLHRALQRSTTGPCRSPPPCRSCTPFLDDEWVSEGYRDPSEERLYLDHGRQVLEAYHRDNADDFRIPAALEYKFSVEIEGVQLVGQIDRLDRIPGGGYEIIDYKTNRRLPPKSRVDKDLQLSLYWLAAREIWGIEAERLTLYYLLPGQRMTTTRVRGRRRAPPPRGSPPSAERIAGRQVRGRGRTPCATGATSRPGARSSATCTRRRRATPRRGSPSWSTSGSPSSARTGSATSAWRSSRATIHAYCEEHEYGRLYGSEGAARRPGGPPRRRLRPRGGARRRWSRWGCTRRS